MGQNKRRADNITRISLLIGFTILGHLLLAPLAYTTNLERTTGRQNLPFALSRDAYITNEANNYELLNNVKINSILSRNLRDFIRLLKRVMDAIIQPVLTIAILLIYTLTNCRNTWRRKSLLAFSLGGHSPPGH